MNGFCEEQNRLTGLGFGMSTECCCWQPAGSPSAEHRGALGVWLCLGPVSGSGPAGATSPGVVLEGGWDTPQTLSSRAVRVGWGGPGTSTPLPTPQHLL